ncbi:sensor histidine kinase [Aureimonas frigidaquae]|uniref:C4-dicarboxylate transport sensor protein DctB n=1 Tax=Aureimonas frigidaquae TaxID=424757 RepID=A0A0P0Z1A5_9HYPH|nr:ATP-binding protein [Aureimonas frigidaquae]BAT27727.1 putative C4-dicarboxylate transport sensor protein DctB [Aureimonas frigidaquae]
MVTFAQPRAWRRYRNAALLIALVATLVYGAGEAARHAAIARLDEEARQAAPLALAVLSSEIEKQRSVPLILSQDTAIQALLLQPEAEALERANRRLEQLAAETRASVIYVIDSAGKTLAASNYRDDQSFVGSNYAFRPYFLRALTEGIAEQYALGTVSQRPGLYLSRSVRSADGTVMGVIVAKVELTGVESAWARSGRPTYVEDGRGVVLATSVPEWRFRALAPLSEAEAERIRDSIQSPRAGLHPLSLEARSDGLVQLRSEDAAGRGALYAEAFLPVDAGPADWRLHLLVPAQGRLAQAAWYWRLVTLLLAVLIGGFGIVARRRRRWARERQAELAQTAAELERRVAERTAALSTANQRLEAEIGERERAQTRVLRLRDDLAQANRLASLGQITAGVAHEINQPLSAIRTYCENALEWLTRRDPDRARGNLQEVIGLTDRIGTITGTLRGFARRQQGPLRVMDIAEPLDGAVMMLRSRMKEDKVTLVQERGPGPVTVLADKTRLEQVFVNLLRNALDATAGQAESRIRIHVENRAGRVIVTVEDNGPGFTAAILERLFHPFSTTRETGLGLGLVISADIIRDLGGELTAGNRPEGGARLAIDLPEPRP